MCPPKGNEDRTYLSAPYPSSVSSTSSSSDTQSNPTQSTVGTSVATQISDSRTKVEKIKKDLKKREKSALAKIEADLRETIWNAERKQFDDDMKLEDELHEKRKAMEDDILKRRRELEDELHEKRKAMEDDIRKRRRELEGNIQTERSQLEGEWQRIKRNDRRDTFIRGKEFRRLQYIKADEDRKLENEKDIVALRKKLEEEKQKLANLQDRITGYLLDSILDLQAWRKQKTNYEPKPRHLSE